MTYTISSLAKELGITIAKLRAPLKRIKSRNLIALSNYDPKEVNAAIKFFSSSYELSEKLYNGIKFQYESSQKLSGLKEIAEEHNLIYKDFKAFMHEVDRNEKFKYLEPNIFTKTDLDCVRQTKIAALVTLYLKKKILYNQVKSAYVPQFDARTGGDKPIQRQKMLHVNLLEAVKTQTFKQGQIVGFYKRSRSGYYPIVALYNGDITVETSIKPDPKSRIGYVFKKRDTQRQPILWSISVNDLIDRGGANRLGNSDHHINHFINMLMDTLAKKHVGCEVVASGTYKDPYIEIRTESFEFNLTDYQITEKDTKKSADEKISVFGMPDMSFLERMVEETTSEYESSINIKDDQYLRVQSKARKVMIAWLENNAENKEMLTDISNYATQTGRSMDVVLGDMIKDYYELVYVTQKEELGNLSNFFNNRSKKSGGGYRQIIKIYYLLFVLYLKLRENWSSLFLFD